MFANVSHFGNPDWIVAYGNHYRGLHTFRRGRFFGLPYQVRGRDSCPYTLTSYPEILELVRNIPDHPESFERPAAVGQFSIRIHGVKYPALSRSIDFHGSRAAVPRHRRHRGDCESPQCSRALLPEHQSPGRICSKRRRCAARKSALWDQLQIDTRPRPDDREVCSSPTWAANRLRTWLQSSPQACANRSMATKR